MFAKATETLTLHPKIYTMDEIAEILGKSNCYLGEAKNCREYLEFVGIKSPHLPRGFDLLECRIQANNYRATAYWGRKTARRLAENATNGFLAMTILAMFVALFMGTAQARERHTGIDTLDLVGFAVIAAALAFALALLARCVLSKRRRR